MRAPIYSRIAAVVNEVRALRTFFAEFGKSVDEMLHPAEHLAFLQRVNLLDYKLQRAGSYLSLHNFRHAQYHAFSASHDLRAMRAVLEKASESLNAHLACTR